MPLPWKYSKERLARHPYCIHILRMKKVICRCGKIIKLGRRYDETFLNLHVNGNGCLAKQGVQSILNFYKPISKLKKIKSGNDVSSAEEWDSDDDEGMNDDDLFNVDEMNEIESDCENEILSDDDMTIPSNNKRKPCPGLRSTIIREYVSRTPAQFGGTRRIEVIAKELFPDLFPKNFSRKKLDYSQKRRLNRQLYAEAVWKVDRDGNCVRSMECERYTNENICNQCLSLKCNKILQNRIAIVKPPISKLKHTPKHYFENDPLKKFLKYSDLNTIWSIIKDNDSDTASNVWIQLADKGIQGAFDKKPVFEGLCSIMLQASVRKEKNISKQNLKYTEEFKNFLVILGTFSPRVLNLFRQNLEGLTIQSIRHLRSNSEDMLTDPTLCFENVARFKRFLDSISYDGPIAAMTDNTKLKPRLRYSSRMGCIIGSTLPGNETNIKTYDDISITINKIKENDAIAKYVRVYLLQVPLPKFPSVIIALLPNVESDKTELILDIHKLLLDFAQELELHIISIGSDGAQVEFNAQTQVQQISTPSRLRVSYTPYNIDFNCPIFSNIGPVIRVQDPKHAKKTGRNAAMSGARALTFNRSTIGFGHFTKLLTCPESPMYKCDVYKLDRQDDGAAYRTFCPKNLMCCLDSNNEIKPEFEGTFIYLFIIGELVDSYLNRNITPIERIRMAMISYFFLRIWRFHINTLARKYPEYISSNQNFIASQTFAILTSLAESIVLLVKAHRDFYNQYPLIPWIHGSEACEHFFGAARQVNADFDFAELLEMVPKIGHYTKALNSKEISFNKEKSVREGYQFEYNQNFIEHDQINLLRTWPDDNQIQHTFDQSRQLACNLAEYLGMLTPDIIPINSLRPYVLITPNDIEISGSDDEYMQNSNENLSNFGLSRVICYAAKEVDLLRQRENERNKMNINEERKNSSLNECKKQLSFIDMDEQGTSDNTINADDNVMFVTKNGIDFQEMIYQREKHNAYTSRNIERIIKTNNNTRMSNPISINSNQANHIVSFFTKNENAEVRFVKQREKRWKNERKFTSQSIADLYKKEQSNKRQKISTNNQNLIKNIESANINHINPLNEQDYIIVYFGTNLCIGQVISSFYEAYGHHSYYQEPITDIENISYLTLKVFTPIRNIFSAETEGGHFLITHQCPKNVLYHLDTQDIRVFDNTLQLLGKAKTCYNFFKREEIIHIITQN